VNFLLDTNVVSEWTKPQPDRNLVAWLLDADEDRLYLSVVSFAEIRHGIELLPPGRRRERLAGWLENELADRFQGRIIDIDQTIADNWGVCMAEAQKAGGSLRSMDAFFAATAKAHALTLVTRNIQDFRKLGIALINPWQSKKD
jgi:predicted nucleic acid-binding protein